MTNLLTVLEALVNYFRGLTMDSYINDQLASLAMMNPVEAVFRAAITFVLFAVLICMIGAFMGMSKREE